jgi:hypothetical protein
VLNSLDSVSLLDIKLDSLVTEFRGSRGDAAIRYLPRCVEEKANQTAA